MGVRLYADKKQGVSTLALFNASFNESMTQDRYEFYLSKKAELSNDDDAWFNWLYESGNEDLNNLNGFEIFGFGKYRYALPSHKDSDGSLQYVGSETDSLAMEIMCIRNDINYDAIKDLINGFHWG